MTVDNLKKFIYHNLENDVSSSAENSERSNMAQYETQKLFQDKRVVPIENKVQCENFSGTESSNLNKNKFDTCGIFTKDLMQQRFLKMKISQQNNPPLGGGRGILGMFKFFQVKDLIPYSRTPVHLIFCMIISLFLSKNKIRNFILINFKPENFDFLK